MPVDGQDFCFLFAQIRSFADGGSPLAALSPPH